MIEIVIRRVGGGESTVRRASRQVTLGRSDWNDLVLTASTVSAHHALVWIEEGTVWIRDLGSANGTFVNNVRLRGPELVCEADEVRLGPDVSLRLRSVGEAAATASALGVEEINLGTRVVFSHDRIRFGAFPDADVHTRDGAQATLIVHPDNECWLGTDEGEVPLAIGQVFRLGQGQFRLVRSSAATATTLRAEREPYPYRLSAPLRGGADGEIVLEDFSRRIVWVIPRGEPAELLRVLAIRWARDRRRGVAVQTAGWCPTAELLDAVWGPGGQESHLNTALHDLRAELKTNGFDPWFLERRMSGLRVRVAEASLIAPSGDTVGEE